ncbi:MAG: hypothetical protein H6718_27030 [Polyangiaceae bacterium]|nr:hypothetical protein [Polyangiaceae bacterium]
MTRFYSMIRTSLSSTTSRLAFRSTKRTRSQAAVMCLLGAAAISSGGCRASVSANANINAGEKEDTQDFDQPLTPVDRSLDESPMEGEYALLGARHDVALTDDAKKQTSACSCLALKVGQPTDPSFMWQGPIPRTDPNSQLVVALSSEGKTCAGEPDDSLGASYWGFKQDGDDIIVIVENARFGRPLTAGAIIPKPLGDGHIYLKPASNSVPYGKASGGEKYCRLM